MRRSISSHLPNVLRGGLIGTAEVVPGISGGTVALIVGVYESIITSAGHVISGLRLAVTDIPRGQGTRRAATEFRQAHWGTILAVLLGMVLAAVLAARFVAPIVESEQQRAYGLFFGLVLASLWVPYSLAGARWKAWHYLLALVVGAGAFIATGLPPAQVEPSPLIIMGAAAIAISALVVPGMSGSFILLTLGLYLPTMDALNNRDFGYIALFMTGALIGGGLCVKLLQWLLEHHRMVTLVALTGCMAGSLRALWPWQNTQRDLHAPANDVFVTFGLIVLGFVIVVGALWWESRVKAKRAAPASPEAAEPRTPVKPRS